MNKLVFVSLLGLLTVGLLFPSFKLALVLAMAKVLLITYFYMELAHAHQAWKFMMTGMILAIFGGLFLY